MSTCPHCGEAFVRNHGNRRFCSAWCLAEFHKARGRKPARMSMACSQCGAVFVPRNSRHETCGAAECKRKRMNAYVLARYYATHSPVVKACVDCGEDFKPGGSAVRCAPCRARPTFSGLVLVRWRGCAQCGKGFRASRIGSERAPRFCSRACWGKAREISPRTCSQCGGGWRPTEKVESRAATRCWECRRPKGDPGVYSSVKESLRRRLILREGGKCQDCGKTAEKVGEPLHAHHVEPQALGGAHTLDNLRLLCPDCHVGSGWWRNHWQLAAAGLVVPPLHVQAA